MRQFKTLRNTWMDRWVESVMSEWGIPQFHPSITTSMHSAYISVSRVQLLTSQPVSWSSRKRCLGSSGEMSGKTRRKDAEKREREKALTHARPLCGWHYDERRGHHPGAGPSKGSRRCDPLQKKKWVPQRSHGSKKTKAWDDNLAQQ